MTFEQALEGIRETIRQHGDNLVNEEMTKQALILPMIEAWGYDIRNPSEVMAEYPVTLPKGGNGRADYVIMHNGKPGIVIECKATNVKLDESVSDQMREYATALGAVAGVATNGYDYECYADVDSAGTIDADPFCFAVLQTLTEGDEDALELLAKANFAPNRLRKSALSHKHELEIRWMAEEFLKGAPARDELYRIAELKDNSELESVVAQLAAKIGEQIHGAVERIKLEGGLISTDDKILTTNEEYDAYSMVKGILHGVIDPSRVDFRDRQTYASVLIDDNNRKPICRFHFNGRQKYLGTFDEEKNETRHAIDGVNDIIDHAAKLRRSARQYADG